MWLVRADVHRSCDPGEKVRRWSRVAKMSIEFREAHDRTHVATGFAYFGEFDIAAHIGDVCML